MKKFGLLVAAVVALSALPGCQLALLPCYICAACASAGNTGATDEPQQAFAEVGPSTHFQTDALKAAVAH